MNDHEVATVFEQHIYEAFKIILSCARNENSHQSLNNLLKFAVSWYFLRSTAQDEVLVPLSITKKLDHTLAKQFPALNNKFIQFGYFPIQKRFNLLMIMN